MMVLLHDKLWKWGRLLYNMGVGILSSFMPMLDDAIVSGNFQLGERFKMTVEEKTNDLVIE